MTLRNVPLAFAFAIVLAASPMHGQRRYVSRDYGVSFRYPPRYRLREGTLPASDPGLGWLGDIPVGFDLPGGVRIVTIEAPRYAYPGTDFVNDFLTVAINRLIGRSDCENFAELVPDPDYDAERKFVGFVSGMTAFGYIDDGVATGHREAGKTYHLFLDDACYSVSYGIATAGYGAVKGMKRVNGKRVVSILERTLRTVKLPTHAKPQKAYIDERYRKMQ